ncbi:MAG: hypothetical protein FJZ01_12490 [Candidatus Sericytochromatia bacterium]|nr:hypothetical protein [Candidatus Tanganyikabacteria bacterium]
MGRANFPPVGILPGFWPAAILVSLGAGGLGFAAPAMAQGTGFPGIPGHSSAQLPFTGYATGSAAAGMKVRAVAEVGNEPTIAGGTGGIDRFRDQIGAVPLVNTQITGRLPFVELTVEQGLTQGIGVRLSGEISQVIRDPITNPDLEDAFLQRQTWRLAGGSAQRPLFVPQLKDAFMALADPDRGGGLQIGQFRVPFGYQGFTTAFPPLAIAPEETPMSDVLGSLGAVDYQPSTLSWRHDIGALVFGRSGDSRYYFGVLNGSGPNRLDDNADKDLFARFDWQTSPTDQIGVSALVGNELGYLGGLGPRPLVPPVKVFRRNYGVHARFALFRLTVQAEWVEAFAYGTESGKDFEAAPRRGWYVDVDGPLGESDRVYALYGNFADPRTPEGRPYLSHQVALGAVHKFAAGLNWRSEWQYRWEYLGPSPNYLSTEYGKYLTSVEWAL